ncbi:FAD binding domain-containing protein [Flavisolibacter ginsenosidimutans]|uniref:2Fe-2S iron-sulfur cluster binding domain-containing protein n=1 Tax=Flavisolibacter ginsenosidimutans TaxID=661481 RepID=A0A5B8UN50_9BACT|nr:FAD binding domain-containing protein [Flavisolibacter ginsenosidimutans]QEC58008.1 2Fe-2S iron-sulfur cluster binding domain-containing protein [Flavisolibacter ginsenosidimutans]
MIRFILNEKEVATNLPSGTLLLDYIRYHRHLMGTKIGCREGDCGACTVLIGEIKNDQVEYSAVTSCLTALANVQGKHVVTIEGLNGDGLNPIQQAMSDESATQCGFCTPGFVVSLAGFCLSNDDHDQQTALASINGNICRCTGYKSIERAATKVSGLMQKKGDELAIDFVIGNKILPAYFKNIKARLKSLPTNGQQLTTKGQRFLGGGTDLYVQQPEAMVEASIVPLVLKEELKRIVVDENTCRVGGAVTVSQIVSSPFFQKHFPDIQKFIKLVSSTPIRNIATIGGNLVNASPIGDLTIFFLALDAQIVLNDGARERKVDLKDFYKGYKTLDKEANEFIKEISFVLPGSQTFFNFEKVSKRTHLDIASVNSAVKLEHANGTILKAHLSAGGVGPVPMYLNNASNFLTYKEVTEDLVFDTIEIALQEISPISDVRGSAEYKRLLLGQLIKSHFLQAFPSLSIDVLVQGSNHR